MSEELKPEVVREKFKVGDVVILKSHQGPRMVIKHVPSDEDLFTNYNCIWFSKDELLKEAAFMHDCLELVVLEEVKKVGRRNAKSTDDQNHTV